MFVLCCSPSVPAAPVVGVASTGPSLAGTTLTLTCNITLLQDLRATPTIEWVGPDGSRIQNGPGVVVSTPFPEGPSLLVTVELSPLQTSHGGGYRCVAAVSIPEASLSLTSSSALNITVQGSLLPSTHPPPSTPPLSPSCSATPHPHHHWNSCG